MAQTAVEWYIEQHKILSSEIRDMPISQVVTKIKSIEQQAKQMERERHSKTFEAGYNRACDLKMGRDDEPDFDQYYTKTYGK